MLCGAHRRGGVGTGCVRGAMGPFCPFPDSGDVQVLDSGQAGTNDFFYRPDWLIKPDSDGCTENRLDDVSVELDQELRRQVELPELAKELHPLLGLLVMMSMLEAHFRSWEIVDTRHLKIHWQVWAGTESWEFGLKYFWDDDVERRAEVHKQNPSLSLGRRGVAACSAVPC